jgi:hypothetical protein
VVFPGRAVVPAGEDDAEVVGRFGGEAVRVDEHEPGRSARARSGDCEGVARVRVSVEVDGAVVAVGVGSVVREAAGLVDDRNRAGMVEVAPDSFDPVGESECLVATRE